MPSLGNAGRSPLPNGVQRFRTASPNTACRANLQANLPIVLNLANLELLLTTDSTDFSLLSCSNLGDLQGLAVDGIQVTEECWLGEVIERGGLERAGGSGEDGEVNVVV